MEDTDVAHIRMFIFGRDNARYCVGAVSNFGHFPSHHHVAVHMKSLISEAITTLLYLWCKLLTDYVNRKLIYVQNNMK